MYDFAVKLFKVLKAKIRQAVKREKTDIRWIGAKPVITVEYVDVTPTNSQKTSHKLIHRQTSERLTIPKPVAKEWYKQDLKAVRIRWIRNPKDAKDVTHLLIAPVFRDDEDVD